MSKLRRAVGAVALAAVVGACSVSSSEPEAGSGGSDDSSAATDDRAGDAPVRGVTDDTIKLGVATIDVNRVRDQFGVNLGGLPDGVIPALVAATNETGGINGRQVEVVENPIMRPQRRARHGLGRTFQTADLFPDLTVRETVMVALEGRGRSSLVANALALPPAGRKERARAAEAADIVDFLGLGRYADTYISELSTGTRRIVELAGLLALDARVLCLDEPTAGVAQRETEAFGPLILAIRRELDASVLVIEHDMPLIMSMSDRVYCLEAGRVIASGPPEAVRSDPAVVASYLGPDERAINRRDAGTAAAAMAGETVP
jgi:ABC-type branched-subunit amino acid transport system ATPase component